MNAEKITALHPGERFSFKGFDWVCLDPNTKEGGVLAIMAKPWKKDMKFYTGNPDEKGNWNNYRTSNVREELLLNVIPILGKDNLLLHEVDLVADNGDRSYGTVEDRVFILTCDEYRKYRDFIPHYDDRIWTTTPWWCGDKDSVTGSAHIVRCVHTLGQLLSYHAYYGNSVAPACIFNPASLNLRRQAQVVEA